jgi:DNA-binding transcriptional MerR regulator
MQEEFWISELADRTNVSTRTIRYYIEEGLLPQPEIRGKYAVFTTDYLHRLRLIKVLKDTYLPLKEIKALLDTLDNAQINEYLERFDRDPVGTLASLQVLPARSQPQVIKDSALEYNHPAGAAIPGLAACPHGPSATSLIYRLAQSAKKRKEKTGSVSN